MSVQILLGEREKLRGMPDASVHCCVTSPPYWGLRAYKGDAGMIGLEPTFDAHLENLVDVFREVRRVLRDDGTLWLNYGSRFAGSASPHRAPERDTGYTEQPDCWGPDFACSGLCGECQGVLRDHYRSARNGSHEPSRAPPSDDRTCRDTGRQDSTAPATSLPGAQVSSTQQSSPPPRGACSPERSQAASAYPSEPDSSQPDSLAYACRGCGRDIPGTPQNRPASRGHSGRCLSSSAWGNYTIAPHKPKDLINMPAFVAEALRADGWYLRSEIIWHKPNPMPESATDRPTTAHEKSDVEVARYFYDAECGCRAVPTSTPAAEKSKMPDGWDTGTWRMHGTMHRDGREKKKTDKQRGHARNAGFNDRWDGMSEEQQAGGANCAMCGLRAVLADGLIKQDTSRPSLRNWSSRASRRVARWMALCWIVLVAREPWVLSRTGSIATLSSSR